MKNDVYAQYQWLEAEFAKLYTSFKFSSEINLRLERMTQLIELIGNPHLAYQSVHIGGTSGKGSTSTMVAQMLQAAGYKVGLHTSPHVQVINERHQVNGRMIPTTQLVEAWRAIKPAVAQVRETSPFGAPSYFEIQVALSFYLFAQEEVDVAVIEVGLGGSIDATNILPADVAVLTNVGLDHTKILGDTVVKIAQDKVGIIKEGQRVISGCTQPEVQAVVAERAAAQNATLWQLGREFDFRQAADSDTAYDLMMPTAHYAGVEVGMQGHFQGQNAAVALAAVTALQAVTDLELDEAAMRTGLRTAKLAGRVERIQEKPLVLLDGAHNEDKMRAVAGVVADEAAQHGEIVTVLSLKSGKDADNIIPFVVELSDKIIFTRFVEKGLWRAVPPHDLARIVEKIDPNLPTQVITDPLLAVQEAIKDARPEDIVWVTGSLYLIGDVRVNWKPIPELLQEIEDAYLIPEWQ